MISNCYHCSKQVVDSRDALEEQNFHQAIQGDERLFQILGVSNKREKLF